MMRSKIIALLVAAAFTVSTGTASFGGLANPSHHISTSSKTPWLPWVIIGCASMIVMTAMVANSRDNRPLTSPEAMSCGILFWLQQQMAAGR
jgi:hypothetical protein